jgi:hypothetical protein
VERILQTFPHILGYKKALSGMEKKKFTTTLDETLIKDVKKLAIDLGLSANDLIEEGIRSVLKKYRRKASRKILNKQSYN